ncbi:MAG: efflux RND transporter periplasmic adaptor subunit [Spartobacteria bacterium]|nr:efflux RND transporter periplasmic adaptor subunit [Spartobacteria bacterium]
MPKATKFTFTFDNVSRTRFALFSVFLIAAGAAGFLYYALVHALPTRQHLRAIETVEADRTDSEESAFQLPEYDGYRITRAFSAPVVRTIRLTGTVAPVRSSTVSPERTGIVREILVSEGVRVGPRVALARLENGEIEAARSEQQHRVSELHREYLSLKSMAPYESYARERMETIRREHMEAKARLKGLETRIEQLTIRAPADGTVTSVNVAVGQEVPIGHPAFTIGDLSHLVLTANVPDSQLAWILPGSRAIIATSGDTPAIESSVSSVSRKAPGSADGWVSISIPGNVRLVPGADYNVHVVTHEETNGVAVPLRSLTDGGAIWLARPASSTDGTFTFKKVPVKVHHTGDSAAAVTGEIMAEDFVLVNPDIHTSASTVSPADFIDFPYDRVQTYVIQYDRFLKTSASGSGGCGARAPSASADGHLPNCPIPEGYFQSGEGNL